MRDSGELHPKRIVHMVSIGTAIKRQRSVMHAVILRDIRSRFFNHGLGFLIVPLFPVGHILVLLAVYQLTGRQAVFGDDLWLFFATGMVPALTFSYISRFMSVSVVANKGMLAFPAVHLLDIMLARCFLEFIGIVFSIAIIFIVLVSVGSNIIPRSPQDALFAMLAVSLLSIGVGTIVSVLSALWPFFPMIYSLSMVLLYLGSGAPIYLGNLPEQFIYYLSFNPAFQAVEWMRSAYYLGYPTQYLDKLYLIMYGLISLNIGLLMERVMKRNILNGA